MKLQTTLPAVAIVALLVWALPAAARQAPVDAKAQPGPTTVQEGAPHAHEGVAPARHGAAQTQEGVAHDAAHDAHASGASTRPGDAAHHGSHNDSQDASHDAGPIPPDRDDTRWVGVLLIMVLTFFVLAAVIGPVARAHAPPVEMPPTHSHDEPPGASHHHGSSGTINPDHGDHSHGSHGHH